MLVIYLALGGTAGTLCRYAVGEILPRWTGTGFPWATFTVNVVGSFILGFVMRATQSGTSPEVRAMLTIGFCGAFTTFSTFGFETLALLREGQTGKAMAYALGSPALGFAAILLGMSAAGAWMQARG